MTAQGTSGIRILANCALKFAALDLKVDLASRNNQSSVLGAYYHRVTFAGRNHIHGMLHDLQIDPANLAELNRIELVSSFFTSQELVSQATLEGDWLPPVCNSWSMDDATVSAHARVA